MVGLSKLQGTACVAIQLPLHSIGRPRKSGSRLVFPRDDDGMPSLRSISPGVALHRFSIERSLSRRFSPVGKHEVFFGNRVNPQLL